MKNDLGALINLYLRDVKKAYRILQDDLEQIDPLLSCQHGSIPRKGSTENIKEFQFHGIGCYILMDDLEVEFDFGPDRNINGFDSWRLKAYLRDNNSRLAIGLDEESLERTFKDACAAGEIRKVFEDQGSQLFYVINDLG